MRFNPKLYLIVILSFFLTGCTQGTGSKYTQHSRTEMIMDTFVQVKVYDGKPENKEIRRETDEIIDEAFQLADRLERRFTIFDPGSEINRLNLAKKRSVSPELFDLLKKAKEVSRLTGGEFDVTVAPILKKEGFYEDMPGSIRENIPDKFDEGGWKNIELSPDRNEVVLNNNIWVDLSGIAKGYIVDRMADFFRNKGIDEFLINAGGDIYCGKKEGKDEWKIGVREPGTEKITLILAAAERAVATSGDYENWIVNDKTGGSVSHIVDPLHSAAIEKELSSITVVTSECADADALATGMMAMGKNKAIALADTMEDMGVIAVTFTSGKYRIDYSKGAREYVIWQEK